MANAQLFARHLRAGNRTPATIRTYLGAIEALDNYIVAQKMPRDVGGTQREHVEAFVEDQLARLKSASAAAPASPTAPTTRAPRARPGDAQSCLGQAGHDRQCRTWSL